MGGRDADAEEGVKDAKTDLCLLCKNVIPQAVNYLSLLKLLGYKVLAPWGTLVLSCPV